MIPHSQGKVNEHPICHLNNTFLHPSLELIKNRFLNDSESHATSTKFLKNYSIKTRMSKLAENWLPQSVLNGHKHCFLLVWNGLICKVGATYLSSK